MGSQFDKSEDTLVHTFKDCEEHESEILTAPEPMTLGETLIPISAPEQPINEPSFTDHSDLLNVEIPTTFEVEPEVV